jgi:thiol-disulfide isomerase/thioredoxin
MKRPFVKSVVILTLFASVAGAAEQKTVRAVLQRPAERKMAPAFRLLSASGKRVGPSKYRGKVVLLDFWATACGGCVAEIPHFIEFEAAYKSKGLAVVGVSLDIMYENLKNADEGWGRVKPFVQEHRVNYPILMGDDPVTKLYNIEAMPATCLIDKHGRVAATYIGIVDKNDVESNIKTLLRE